MISKKQRLAAAAAAAAALAIPFEGLRQYAYSDPVGILTVCVGHTGSDIERGRKYSLADCHGLLTDDMRIAIEAVDRCAPGLPDGVLAAFGDAVFNAGPKIACDQRRSTAARHLAARNLTAACNELPKWNKATVAGQAIVLPGLTRRRLAEQKLCLESLND